MPRIEATRKVPVPIDDAFVVSQSQQPLRYRWDPFVREQRLMDGANRPASGVRTFTRSRHGLKMISRYTSFRRPTQVGMKMVEGPFFFGSFGGGWSFAETEEGFTEATWRYTFTVRPKWLSPVADPIGVWILRRDIERRIEGFVDACSNTEIVAQARAQLDSA